MKAWVARVRCTFNIYLAYSSITKRPLLTARQSAAAAAAVDDDMIISLEFQYALFIISAAQKEKAVAFKCGVCVCDPVSSHFQLLFSLSFKK